MSKRVKKRVNALKVVLLEDGKHQVITRYIQTIGQNFTDEQVRNKLNNIGLMNYALLAWQVEVLELLLFE